MSNLERLSDDVWAELMAPPAEVEEEVRSSRGDEDMTGEDRLLIIDAVAAEDHEMVTNILSNYLSESGQQKDLTISLDSLPKAEVKQSPPVAAPKYDPRPVNPAASLPPQRPTNRFFPAGLTFSFKGFSSGK